MNTCEHCKYFVSPEEFSYSTDEKFGHCKKIPFKYDIESEWKKIDGETRQVFKGDHLACVDATFNPTKDFGCVLWEGK